MKLLLRELSETAGSVVKAITALIFIFNIVLFLLGGRELTIVSVTGTAIGLTLIFVQLVRRHVTTLLTEIRSAHNQLQSFVSLVEWLKPRRALPTFPLFGATVLPDLALKMASIVHKRKPSVIVELGSGVSTIVLGYCAQSIGASVWSLEHDDNYARASSRLVEEHELDDVVTVVHAPLSDIDLDGKKWRWYRTDALQGLEQIDMLFVDGPPGDIQRMSRYPALPVFLDRLSGRFFAILDDVIRADERKILEEWQSRIPNLLVQPLGVQKGAVLVSFASV